MHLHDLTIKKFHQGLLDKQFSAAEIVKEYYDRIETRDQEIEAYLSLAKEDAFLQAEKTDIKIAKGETLNPLDGAPLAIKDNILISGQPATAASKMLEKYVAAYDATVISKLKSSGAVFLGKTNMDEFAMGSSTETSAFKRTKNPRDLERVPGGSSGGSVAAVADSMALAALGSDTGGSIRQPASFCGVVGLKPTYGAVSRYGLIAMASSLDHIGPITKTVEDAEILFKAIAGEDLLDSTSANFPVEDKPELTLDNLKNMTIGIPDEYFVGGLDQLTSQALDNSIKLFKSLGINFKNIHLPHTKYALSCYYIIMPAEVSSNLSRLDGVRYARLKDSNNLLDLYRQNKSAGFGDEVQRRIMLGTFVLSSGYYDAYYSKAQKVRSLIKNDFMEAFKEVDMILTPVAPTVPFKFGEKTNDPLAMYLSDIFTIPVNLAGLPAISIPANQKPELPVGFQLIGKHWREREILTAGKYYEQAKHIT